MISDGSGTRNQPKNGFERQVESGGKSCPGDDFTLVVVDSNGGSGKP